MVPKEFWKALEIEECRSNTQLTFIPLVGFCTKKSLAQPEGPGSKSFTIGEICFH